MLHVWYIYLHLGDFIRANVGKYTIHGAYGHHLPNTVPFFFGYYTMMYHGILGNLPIIFPIDLPFKIWSWCRQECVSYGLQLSREKGYWCLGLKKKWLALWLTLWWCQNSYWKWPFFMGKSTINGLKMTINSGFSHEKWWFSIAILT